jgi:hypothetical protein
MGVGTDVVMGAVVIMVAVADTIAEAAREELRHRVVETNLTKGRSQA